MHLPTPPEPSRPDPPARRCRMPDEIRHLRGQRHAAARQGPRRRPTAARHLWAYASSRTCSPTAAAPTCASPSDCRAIVERAVAAHAQARGGADAPSNDTMRAVRAVLRHAQAQRDRRRPAPAPGGRRPARALRRAEDVPRARRGQRATASVHQAVLAADARARAGLRDDGLRRRRGLAGPAMARVEAPRLPHPVGRARAPRAAQRE